MLGRISCGISVFLLVIVAVIIGFDDDSFFEPIEVSYEIVRNV